MADQESPTATAPPLTCSSGPWTASCAERDGIKKDWWHITTPRGERYQYQQDLAMVFDAEGHGEANATLMAASQDLLTSCEELREACACAMRVLVNEPLMMDAFTSELERSGISNGFGVRADAAIAKAVPR